MTSVRLRIAMVIVSTVTIVSAITLIAPVAEASPHSSGTWAIIGANPWPGISGFSGVSCATTSDCWVTGATQGGAAAILATTDGRKTWTTQTVPAGVTSIGDISCPTSTVCFATGVANGDPAIISTSNGGSIWALDTLPTLQYLTGLGQISCAPGQGSVCFAIGGDNQPTVHEFYVLSTTNGGSSWSDKTLGAGGISIDCPTTTVCLIGVQNLEEPSLDVDYTHDGGSTWSSTIVGNNEGVPSWISCASAEDCWVAGLATGPGINFIDQTTNGGASWTASQDFASGISLRSISCPNTSDCWAAGEDSSDNGVMFSTTDGGTVWKQGTVAGGAEAVSDTDCPAPYVCLATSSTSSGPVLVGSLLRVTSLSPPSATRGTAYTYQLTAIGGRPNYSWSTVSGNLPTGILLSNTGTLSGTPRRSDAPGTYTFKVMVTDQTPGTPQKAKQSLAILLS